MANERFEEQQRQVAEQGRAMLGGFVGRAAEILQELAEFAENDRVRLSAVNSILDRSGVSAPQEILVSASREEHDLVRLEAEETLMKLEKNRAVAIDAPKPSLEAVMVIEGDEPEPEVLYAEVLPPASTGQTT